MPHRKPLGTSGPEQRVLELALLEFVEALPPFEKRVLKIRRALQAGGGAVSAGRVARRMRTSEASVIEAFEFLAKAGRDAGLD